MDCTETLLPPIISVMLLKSIVVVTTFIEPALVAEIIMSSDERIEIIFFMIYYLFNYLLYSFLILMCAMCTNYKYPTQPKLVETRLNINIGYFAFKFYFLKFSCQPACT